MTNPKLTPARHVKKMLSGGQWLTLWEIQAGSPYALTTISAYVRVMRNKYGFDVEKMRKPGVKNTWLYRIKGGAMATCKKCGCVQAFLMCNSDGDRFVVSCFDCPNQSKLYKNQSTAIKNWQKINGSV